MTKIPIDATFDEVTEGMEDNEKARVGGKWSTLEALAVGCPVLGYQHGGVGEILDALFPLGKISVGDTETLAQTLRAWKADKPKPQAQSIFTLENMCRQTLNVYKELIK